MTPSGQRNRRVAFERPLARQSAMGREPAKDFDQICSAWAKVIFGTGAERRSAGVEGATQVAAFRVLSSSLTRLVTPRDTIWFADRRWNITSIAQLGVNEEIEFTAVAGEG